MNRKKLSEFWLIPFLTGIFVSMGYVTTSKILLPKMNLYSNELRLIKKEEVSSPLINPAREIRVNSKRIDPLQKNQNLFKSKNSEANKEIVPTVPDSKRKEGSMEIQNHSNQDKKTYDSKKSNDLSTSTNFSSKVDSDSSISQKELFNNLFETLPEPK